jgi:hypothetical protein
MSAPRDTGKKNVIDNLNKTHGWDGVTRRDYALGLIDGVAEWLAVHYGRQATYESLMRIADRIIAPDLPKGK